MLGGAPMGTIQLAGRGPGVLALHGFGATPQEVYMAVEVAAELGLRTCAPLLPGHGVSVQALAATRWSDWRSAAEEAFQALASATGGVIVVGCSMGSLLALDLAADHPQLTRGVAALAPATQLSFPFPRLGLALVGWLGVPDFTIPKSAPDIRDAHQRRTQVTYSRQPARAGNEVRLAGSRVLGRLGQVRAPAFVAHGALDHVCPVQNARDVYARLGTPAWEKELLILPRSYHIVTRDLERGRLRERLHAFVRRVARGTPNGSHTPVEP
jgi:carboxylesterase